MDFKGVAWAGDIYQKFEAMCLEVEEVMYQDTVKYVENQAQKVGASVKKFYSEVMQDLLPSSCVDPVKVAAGDLSLNPYAHMDSSKKPKSFLLDSPRELKKMKTEDEAISDTILPPPRSEVLVQNTCSEMCSSKSKKLGVYRRPIGIKRISQLDRPSKISSPPTSLLKLGSSEGAFCGGSGGHMKASGDMNLKTPSDSVERRDPEPVNESCGGSGGQMKASGDMNLKTPSDSVEIRDPEPVNESFGGSGGQMKTSGDMNLKTPSDSLERCDPEPVNESTPVSDAKIESSVSDKIMSAGSVRKKKDESVCTSSLGTSVNGSSIPQTVSHMTTNACDIETLGERDNTIKPDLFSESTPDVSSGTRNVEFAVEEVVISNEENFDMEVIQNEEAAEPRIETFETFDGSNLEDTCVFVDGDNLDFLSQGTGKHKSYKKKIRDALSSKLRSTRKVGHTSLGGKINSEETTRALSTEPGANKNKMARDSLESEWELL